MPHLAGSLTTRLLLPASVTYRLPTVSTATPLALLRPVNGSTVGVLEPAASFRTWVLVAFVT